jgi:ubiquinol-cytochrome c reductase cytochrome b subunit
MITRRVARWADQRLGGANFARTALGKVFPDHWSFLIGEIALYSFVVLVLTGTYLTFFFHPGQQEVVYDGAYAPLRGVEMTEAYRSALELSFDVRAGLVMRQIHHWAALLFLAAIVVHLMRVFFTGAFRRPREINWIVGVVLLILGIFNGFAGYSLLDDQLSGTGLRIAYSITLSIPVAGTWLASLLFGGEFPGPDIITRLYVIHILLIPAVIVGLIGAHLAILVRQKHTQFPGPGRREDNVIGERVWPAFAFKSIGLMFITAAVLCAMGGLAQINPVWLYGPFRPDEVSSASQPDWYMGWLDGSLRLFPNWEIRAGGYQVPNPFFPAVLMAGVTFGLLFAWPFLEARWTGDYESHHLLDRPRDRPVRTMLGVATLAFYTVLTLAAATDVTATTFGVSVNGVVRSFRALAILAPPIAGFVAYRLCKELQARDIARGIPVPNPQPPPRRSGSRWRPPPRPDRDDDGGAVESETARVDSSAVES